MENKAYFDELSRVLKKHNIESGPVENGRLVILLNGQSVGRIEKGAIRCVAPGDLQTAEASEAFYKAAPYACEYEDEFTRRIMANKLAEQMDNQAKAKQRLGQESRRIAEIDTIIRRLYEDSLTGKLSDERFAKMTADYEQEQTALKVSSAELRQVVENCETQSANIKRFVKLAKGYIAPETLAPTMLHELVDKIIVYAPDKSSGHRTQQIDIHYTFVDEIELPCEIDQKETA